MAKRESNSARSLIANDKLLFFATNRANVLSILSSGLIRPRAGYEKYYDDLLELCPGHIPLFHNSIPRSLVPLLSSSEPWLFPVLVEIDPKCLPETGKVAAVKTDLTLDLAVAGHDENVLCKLVASPIPAAAITRLCFASMENLDDFKARNFENVPTSYPLAHVGQAIAEGGPDPDQFRAVLQAVMPAVGSAYDFRCLDAAMGAMAMLSVLLPAKKVWLDGVAAAAAFPKSFKAKDVGTPKWLTSLICQIMSREPTTAKGLGTDELLMAAAIRVLCSMNPRDGWVEAKVATDIATQAKADANPGDELEIEEWRKIIIAVAKADKPVGVLEDTGSVVRRGLMLLLLRCQPERILLARESDLKPGPQVTAIAGMLSGLFHGYSRLSKELKTRGCPVDLLSQLAVTWWSSVDGKGRKTAVTTSVDHENATTAKVTIRVKGDVFIERFIQPNDAMIRLFSLANGVLDAFVFDPALDAFVHQVNSAGNSKRKIIIKAGKPTLRNQATIRVSTTCLESNGKPVRLTKREDALALLEWNHDPVTQCQFVVEPGTGNTEVLVRLVIETMESADLQSQIDAVVKVAKEFEANRAKRLEMPPLPSVGETSEQLGLNTEKTME